MPAVHRKALEISIPATEPQQIKTVRRPSLVRSINAESVIREPNKLKLYAVLAEQAAGRELSQRYAQYRAVRLDREAEDKALLKTLFGWTEDTAAVEQLDFEIIVGDKFSMTSSAQNTPRAGHLVTAFSANTTPRAQPVSFDEVLRSKYEAYKQNYNSKAADAYKPSNPQRCGVFAERQCGQSYDSCSENADAKLSGRTLPKGGQASIKMFSSCAQKPANATVQRVGYRVQQTALRQRDENDARLHNVRDAQILRLKHTLNMHAM